MDDLCTFQTAANVLPCFLKRSLTNQSAIVQSRKHTVFIYIGHLKQDTEVRQRGFREREREQLDTGKMYAQKDWKGWGYLREKVNQRRDGKGHTITSKQKKGLKKELLFFLYYETGWRESQFKWKSTNCFLQHNAGLTCGTHCSNTSLKPTT